MKCSEDIEDISRMQVKLKLPSSPTDPSMISMDIKRLNYMIGARYVGGASLLNLKTPEEGDLVKEDPCWLRAPGGQGLHDGERTAGCLSIRSLQLFKFWGT